MFNFLKQDKVYTGPEKPAQTGATHENRPVLLTAPDQGIIEDDLLDEVSGGINPQPLPPKGDDLRHKFPIF